MEGLGQQLSAARIARNLSIDEVAARIHMRPEYIAALEEERWSDIGDPLYVRGFLRTYAHFLDLSAERFIAEYRAKAPDGIKLLGPQTPEEVELSVKRAGNSLAAFVAVAAFAVLIGGGLIAFVVRSANSAAAVASDSAMPVATAAIGSPSPSASISPAVSSSLASAVSSSSPVASASMKPSPQASALSRASAKPSSGRPPDLSDPEDMPSATAPFTLRTATPAPGSAARLSAPSPHAAYGAAFSLRSPAPAATSSIRRVELPQVHPSATAAPQSASYADPQASASSAPAVQRSADAVRMPPNAGGSGVDASAKPAATPSHKPRHPEIDVE